MCQTSKSGRGGPKSDASGFLFDRIARLRNAKICQGFMVEFRTSPGVVSCVRPAAAYARDLPNIGCSQPPRACGGVWTRSLRRWPVCIGSLRQGRNPPRIRRRLRCSQSGASLGHFPRYGRHFSRILARIELQRVSRFPLRRLFHGSGISSARQIFRASRSGTSA
jgi:hypothetical protein